MNDQALASRLSSLVGPSPAQIQRIEWTQLTGRRPRTAKANARLVDHGADVRIPTVRLTADDGSIGFGRVAPGFEPKGARDLIGTSIVPLPVKEGLPHPLELPLWDLIARRKQQPVYALAAELTGADAPKALSVRCYDTSLYIDDLHIEDHRSACELIADEAEEGAARGHTAFKVKVGRGGRHLPTESGMQRDVLVIEAVRKRIGPAARLMADANNGFTLNLTTRFLEETSDSGLYWMEEPFHEDPVLLAELRRRMAAAGLNTLIADGEGHADPRIEQIARSGSLDVLQYDINSHGFSRWLVTARQLADCQVRLAPHSYGNWFGNFAAGHLGPALGDRFAMVEWDQIDIDGVDTGGYRILGGRLQIPDGPGFAIECDRAWFEDRVAADGFIVE